VHFDGVIIFFSCSDFEADIGQGTNFNQTNSKELLKIVSLVDEDVSFLDGLRCAVLYISFDAVRAACHHFD